MDNFKLEDHHKSAPGFQTPPGYFEGFSARITQQLAEEPKVIALKPNRRNWIVAAAAVLVLALMVPVYNNSVAADEPDAAAIENYITYGSGISQYELIDLMDSEDIQSLDDQLVIENVADATIEDILTSHNNFENYITEQQ